MKIAAVSEDGLAISQHFGRAPIYVVIEVEDGKVTNRETRAKAGHSNFAGPEEHHEACGGPHGCDSGSEEKHAIMGATIADCQVLLAGGMGWGAYASLKSQRVDPIVTDIENIDEAVKAYLDGTIQNLFERVH
jgi:predicted Fe-Mo cluster-binding NifX family protein